MTDLPPRDAGDERFIRTLAILGAVSFVALGAVYALTLRTGPAIPRDASGLVIGRDFLNVWTYGRAALSAAPWRWYDLAAYHHALAAMLGPHYPGQNWSYPPSIMLLAAPFGLMGYLPALALWSLLGLGLFALSVWRRVRDGRVLFLALVSPAAAMCLTSGQEAFFIAALFLGLFWLAEQRPALAGGLIGLLTIKPQLGVFIPVALIASRRWKLLAWATAGSLAVFAASLAFFGVHSWTAFVHQGIPAQDVIAADPHGALAPFSPTLFVNLRSAGLGFAPAMAAQALVAVAALAAVGWAFRARRKADPVTLFALFVAATTAALPYLLVYDTLPLTVAALLLLAEGRLDATGRVLAAMVYLLPLLQAGFGLAHIPGPALIAPAFTAWLVLQLRGMPATRPASGPASGHEERVLEAGRGLAVKKG